MSLQLILGSSGAGKSHYIFNRMIEESMENPNTNYLVIVPEQFTMETQKDFITMHKNHGIMNIDVLSFMRLAYRIMEEMGMKDVSVLEDTGKNMVFRRVLEELTDSLSYFKSNIRKPGFVDEVKSMLSELYQYNIGTDKLADMIELAEHKPLLRAKLRDLLVIYKGFREFLQNKYITAEEIMDVLYDALQYSNVIENSVICLDGFTGFTPSQYKVLSRLFLRAKKVYVTVTIDEREELRREGEEFLLFQLSKKTIKKLEKIAFDNKIDVLDPIFPRSKNGSLWRFGENSPLVALEKNLFRYPFEAYLETQESIWIRELKTPKDEVRFVVRQVKEMLRKGYRYRDFAVVSGDIQSYGRIIEQEFLAANISFFMDEKREIAKNPFVVLINSLLELLRKQMDYESMFHYLRCGMVPFEAEEVDRLENYCLAFGIRGKKKWKNPFTKCMNGMDDAELFVLNEIRERVVESIGQLEPLFGNKKHMVGAYVEGLYDTLISLATFERLSSMEDDFTKKGQLLLAKEYGQVYGMIMEIFERMMELLGDEEVTLLEFQDILNAGISKAKVGVIPTGIDQIVVGDIERTRLKDIKVLFFIGVNDGVVPKAVQGGGILSDMERELLKQKKVELAPTKREKIYTERFYLYLNLTKPSDKAFLTFCKTDFSGKAVKASYLIGKIKQIFPEIKMEEEKNDWDKIKYNMDEDAGRDCLLEGIREFECVQTAEMDWKIIYSWYFEQKKSTDDFIQYITDVYGEHTEGKISEAVAKALYGDNLVGSVTRLEQFASCACAHFLSYGLRLKERQEFKLNIPDMGNIFHAALELFSKRLEEKKLTWQTISLEEREMLGEECVREVTMEYGNTIFHSSKRNEYMIERISRILKRTLWALTMQLSQGEFQPSGYELKFSYMDDLESVRIPLGESSEMRLTGRIDRVDLCRKDDDIYVKVVDYKSGKKTFNIVDLYYGLELQLVVYMGTMLERIRKDYPEQNVLPAGIFYYNINDPIIEKKDLLFHESDLLKELRVNGLVNEKKEVIQALDCSFIEKELEELKPSVKSDVIPVETVKLGNFSKYSSVATKEEFEQIISFARGKMLEFGEGIFDGQCEKNPYKLGEKTACDYCQYGAVCAFDKKSKTDHYRVLEPFSKDEILQKIFLNREKDEGEKG
ncbi:MAG: helicase-exonuclease AddAB subunit AddB [Velocimicrobium sp.]